MQSQGENSKLKSPDGTVYNFWLLSVAEADLIKEIRGQILKDASKKANFPGFRKVSVVSFRGMKCFGDCGTRLFSTIPVLSFDFTWK